MSADSAPRSLVSVRRTSSLAKVMAIAFGAAAAGGCMGAGVGGDTDAGPSSGGSSGSSGGATQPGSGGATTSSGGATQPGSGGATTSSGGATQPGSGGATTSSGGASQPGTGGARSGGAPGSGGATTGSGGASQPGTGGARTGGAPGTGGAGTGGARTGGAPGTGGAGTGGAGTGGAPTGSATCTWPTPSGSPVSLSASMKVSGSFDGGMKRYVGTGDLGGTGQEEGQDPLFDLAAGATLSNVIIGSPAADGVHCAGACTLKNVWWEDVGEDAATSRGTSSSQVMTIDGGGARGADDKVFQHNGAGTMIIKNFCAQDFGKLYRSCGNCSSQSARKVQMENLKIIPRSGSVLAGVNSNYKDVATFKNITVQAKANGMTICTRYTGNSSGDEPTTIGTGADGTSCIYQPTDIIWTQ